MALTGGRGACLEELGAKLCTPLITYRKRVLPFHSMLWAACQAFRAVIRLLGVPPACFLKLEAAKAHKTNSSAGKRMCSGIRSSSQNWMNCLIVPVYRLRVASAHPPWMARETLSLALRVREVVDVTLQRKSYKRRCLRTWGLFPSKLFRLYRLFRGCTIRVRVRVVVDVTLQRKSYKRRCLRTWGLFPSKLFRLYRLFRGCTLTRMTKSRTPLYYLFAPFLGVLVLYLDIFISALFYCSFFLLFFTGGTVYRRFR